MNVAALIELLACCDAYLFDPTQLQSGIKYFEPREQPKEAVAARAAVQE